MAYKTKIGFRRPHDRKATQADDLVLDKKTGELVKMPSMTKQAFVAQCDINNILKQFKLTGMVQHMSAKAAEGRYEDLPDAVDFQEALNAVHDAQAAFASLPSKVRNRFENDPAQFLEFMSDPKNQEEVYELGLAVRPIPLSPDSPLGEAGDKVPDKDP